MAAATAKETQQGAMLAAERIKAAALAANASKGLSKFQAERAASAAARNVNAYGQKEEGPSRWQERKEAKRMMYMESTEQGPRLGVRLDKAGKGESAAATCQRCYRPGHWTYECKNERVYVSRPSRTQQLKNPKYLRAPPGRALGRGDDDMPPPDPRMLMRDALRDGELAAAAAAVPAAGGVEKKRAAKGGKKETKSKRRRKPSPSSESDDDSEDSDSDSDRASSSSSDDSESESESESEESSGERRRRRRAGGGGGRRAANGRERERKGRGKERRAETDESASSSSGSEESEPERRRRRSSKRSSHKERSRKGR